MNIMTSKTRKIIAREGLVFIGIIVSSVFLGYNAYSNFWTKIAPTLEFSLFSYFSTRTLGGAILGCATALYAIYLSGWFIYFIIHFIIWAAKVLMKRNVSASTEINAVKASVVEKIEGGAGGINIGYNKAKHATTINNSTLNFIANFYGVEVSDVDKPEIIKRAGDVLVKSANAVKSTPEEKFKSIHYDMVALNDTSAIASGISANALIKNADYIFKGMGQPTIEVKFVKPSNITNVFDVVTPSKYK